MVLILSRQKQHDAQALDRLASRVQKRLERVIRVPWILATSEDFRHGKGVEGRMTMLNHLVRWYTELAMHNHGVAVSEALYETGNLVDPYALLKPGIAIRVLFSTSRRSYREMNEYVRKT